MLACPDRVGLHKTEPVHGVGHAGGREQQCPDPTSISVPARYTAPKPT